MSDMSPDNMTDTSSSENGSPLHQAEELRKFKNLYNAVRDGNLNETKVIIESLPEVLNERISDKNETALHIAVINGHEHIVEELVNKMSDESLAMYDNEGWTALIIAAVHGKWRMAECMLQRKPDLISIGDSKANNQLPVVIAIDYQQIEMARRLYYLTPDKDLIPQDNDQKIQYLNAAKLLNNAIYTETLDIALDLIQRCPRLALALDDNGVSPTEALASMSQSFSRENQLGLWRKHIYYYILRTPPSTPRIRETRLNFSNREQCQSNQEEDQNNKSVLSAMFRYIVSGVLNFCGITQLYEMKKIHVQCNELLSQMCKVISESDTEQLKDGQVYEAIFLAAKNGNFAFLSKMLEVDRGFFTIQEVETGTNIFMLGVLHRQEKIFSILYGLDTTMNYFTCLEDDNKNNMLHMASRMIEDSTMVNQIQGTALQMQRELQWFKEVERIVHPKAKEAMNHDDLTPRQLFTKNHKNMMEKGEKWMKDTASSCTVVGALIVTIMLAVAFAIPGGNNQTTGFPIFLKKKLFMLFIISDALSLFSSSTSVLMFLGILTSRYTEEDFLEYLPRQMIIGLLTLFFSIATMMMTFSSTLLIILHEQPQIAIPLFCLASVPVSFFVCIQFPILKDMIISTYGPGIFDKKMKSKLI